MCPSENWLNQIDSLEWGEDSSRPIKRVWSKYLAELTEGSEDLDDYPVDEYMEKIIQLAKDYGIPEGIMRSPDEMPDRRTVDREAEETKEFEKYITQLPDGYTHRWVSDSGVLFASGVDLPVLTHPGTPDGEWSKL